MTINRRRFKQIDTMEDRCSAEADRLREAAELLPHGPVREAAIRKARQMDAAAHTSRWLRSSELQYPD